MDKYFYIENDNQFGPFTIQELKEKKITTTTLVWTENLENWIEAQNINELKDITKKNPPPIPNRNEKPIKIEAEIIKKKEKIITQESEIQIANEAKHNFKLLKISLLISLFSMFYFLYENNGIQNKIIEIKLENDMHKNAYNLQDNELELFLQNRENLKNESFSLGYGGYSKNYFSTNSALDYHKERFRNALTDAATSTFVTFIVSLITLIVGRYLFKGAKWVEKKQTINK